VPVGSVPFHSQPTPLPTDARAQQYAPYSQTPPPASLQQLAPNTSASTSQPTLNKSPAVENKLASIAAEVSKKNNNEEGFELQPMPVRSSADGKKNEGNSVAAGQSVQKRGYDRLADDDH